MHASSLGRLIQNPVVLRLLSSSAARLVHQSITRPVCYCSKATELTSFHSHSGTVSRYCSSVAALSSCKQGNPENAKTDGKDPSHMDPEEFQQSETDEHLVFRNLPDSVKGNDELMETVVSIKKLYEKLKSFGQRVPDDITEKMWFELLEQTTTSSRRKLFSFYRQRELKKKAAAEKKMIKREQRLKEMEETCVKKVNPDLANIPLSLAGLNRAMNEAKYYKLAHAAQFGTPLIFDLAFDIPKKVMSSLIHQLMESHGCNIDSRDPFHFVFCNAQEANPVVKGLNHPSNTRDYMFRIEERDCHEIFPRKRLVYLSPHAKKYMEDYDHNAIYIIGGIVDLAGEEPLTYKKAKSLGIKTVKFPLDQYLRWKQGSKALTLDCVVRILLELKSSGDWHKAFSHIPTRKVRSFKDPT